MSEGRRVTVKQVMALCPCGHDGLNNGSNYTVERVAELWGGKEALTAPEIAALNTTHDVPQRDIVWVLIRMLGNATKQCDFARWSARRVLHLWDAPDIVRRYLETGNESIRSAAYAAYVAYAYVADADAADAYAAYVAAAYAAAAYAYAYAADADAYAADAAAAYAAAYAADAYAADDAADAAYAAAAYAADAYADDAADAARDAQIAQLVKVIEGTSWFYHSWE